MPYQVANTFNPMTPWGEGIQNITRALFSGPTPMEQEAHAAQAEARRLQAEHYRAQTESLRAKTAAEAQARTDMQNAPRRLAGALLGNQAVADQYINARDGVKTDQYRGSDGGDGPLTAMAPTPMPQLDPNMTARVARLLTGVEAAKALPGNDNLGALAKFLPALMGDELRQGAIGGAPLKPEQYGNLGRTQAAMEGKALFHDGKFGGMDNFSGQLVNPQLFNAEVSLTGEKGKTEQSKQVENRAQAGAANARAADERKQTELRGGMTDWTDPATGVTYRVPTNTLATERIRVDGRKDVQDNKDANKPPGAGKAPIKVDAKLLRTELKRLTDESDERVLDPMFANQVVSRATQLAQEQGGEFWGKPVEAVRVALMEATNGADLADNTGSFRDKNKRFAPPGFKPQAAPNPVARQIVPPGSQKSGTSAPPAAVEFYRANKDKPGVRDQFMKKYGYDPEMS